MTELPSPSTRTLLCVVDESDELPVALTFAALRSRRTGSHVGLLYVIDTPADFQHWSAVGELMREEAREHAETVILQAAAQVQRLQRLSGRVPSLAIREGDKVDETIQACEEDPSVAFLILASDTGPKGPGPLISLADRKVGRPLAGAGGHPAGQSLRRRNNPFRLTEAGSARRPP